MNRLTLKDIDNYTNLLCGGRTTGKGFSSKMLEELKEYKHLEEELNFDLTTLLKAFRNGIHYINEGIEWAIPIRFDYKLCRLYVGEETYFKLEDYGKTWALTKEELMDNE